MFSMLHLTDIVSRFFPGGIGGPSKDGPEAILFGFEVLRESRTGFPIAAPLQEMLRKTAIECGIRLPRNIKELMASPDPLNKDVFRMDDLIDACTRPSYIQPVGEIHERYLLSFAADWASDGASYGFFEPASGVSRMRIPSAEERGAQSLMQIRNLLNTN
jgi:hypothetical protein